MMYRRLYRVVPLLAAAALLAGCISTGLYETARTAPPGKFQGGVSVEPAILAVSEEGATLAVFPNVAMKAKLGLSRATDIGFKVGGDGMFGLNGKYQFLRGTVDGAFHASGSFFGFFVAGEGAGWYTLSPRFVLSSEKVGQFPFCVHLGVSYFGLFASSEGEAASGGVLMGAGGLGLPFRLGSPGSLRLMPELSVGVPFLTTASFDDGNETITYLEGAFFRLGIDVSYVGANRD